MDKIWISSTELVWVFRERLEAFDDCSREVPIAIVPAPDVGWMALWPAKEGRRPFSLRVPTQLLQAKARFPIWGAPQ